MTFNQSLQRIRLSRLGCNRPPSRVGLREVWIVVCIILILCSCACVCVSAPAVARSDYLDAYALVAQTTKTTGDLTVHDGPLSFERFTGELTVDRKRIAVLEEQIAGKRKDALETSHGPPRSSLFVMPELELADLKSKLQRTRKCANYLVGDVRVIANGRVEVPVNTQVAGGISDNDVAILVREADAWVLANPLHIIP